MIKKPKITIFHCSFIYRGGGERIVIEEVLGLRKRGYQVECYAPLLDKRNCYPDLIDKVGVKTFLPQLPRFFPLRYALVMILSCLLGPFFAPKFKETDLFIGANQPGAWFAYLISKILKKPYLVYFNHPNRVLYPRGGETWHTVWDFYLLDKILKIFRPLVTYLDKISFCSGKAALTNGFFIRKEIEGIYPIKTIPCPSGTWISQKNLNKKESDQFLLFIGRHEAWKKIDWAILAFKKVLKEFPNLSLVIPGPPVAQTKVLKKLAQDLNLGKRVFFPGEINQKQLERLYKEATIFVFPSPKEDFGIVVLEAMGAGLPVVAWRAGGPTDSVIDEETGFLAKPYDLSDFAQKITILLKNPSLRLKMGQAAKNHIQKNFTWKKHCDILEKEIKKALA